MPGVYISYPFCNQKCTFCNFASDVASQGARDVYGSALLQEIRAHAWQWQPQTLYFGGGTPSLMSPHLLESIVRSIPQSALTEFTMECAPGTIDQSKVKHWVKLGVNRVSLGVQSFINAELRRTGRKHDRSTVERDVETLRRCGIENFNLDLIAGLPGQTALSWKESLGCVAALQPPHVSVYLFEVDEDSRLGKEVILGGSRYGAAELPDDDLAADLYGTAVEFLRSIGIQRYEISNFAMAGKQSLHNLKYWTLAPYIGFGLDAASFDGVNRWSNHHELASYLTGKMDPPVRAIPEQEAFFVGLRLSDGIETNAAAWSRYGQAINRWLEAGMLEQHGGKLRLTDRGVLVSNEVLADFV